MLDPQAVSTAQSWLQADLLPEDRVLIESMMAENPKEFNECFYQSLSFGTGGLRGIMRMGSNGINRYTIGLATQGLANALLRMRSEKGSVAIAYDSRNQSKEFAQLAAEILAANDIDVHLFESLRPTPLLSFAVRELECSAGIVITASHNPKEYNGFKVYQADGGQIVPPTDQLILDAVRATSIKDIQWTGGNGDILILDDSFDASYYAQLKDLSLSQDGKKDLKIVFTALHGTSITMLPQALSLLGFEDVHVLESQAEPDGDFPTVHSPNPEEPAALALALSKADEIGADLVIGCDPDTDRVGIAVRDADNQMILLNGNQAASVLVDYVLKQMHSKQELPTNAFIASTVVTSPLLEKVATAYGVTTEYTLTGFKWIADLIETYQGRKQFIVGGEESYGYLVSDFVRDKDAVSSACMLAEAAAFWKAHGGSFYSRLIELFAEHGTHHEVLKSFTFQGREGAEKIKGIMDQLRHDQPQEIANIAVDEILDFAQATRLNLPKSDVIQVRLINGDIITARPSGTEPKIKFYYCTTGQKVSDAESYKRERQALEKRIASYQAAFGA